MFETSLIDTQKSRWTPRMLVTSAGFHFALFATVASAAYWHISPVVEPLENAVYIVPASLPPPPPAGGPRARTETAPPKPAAPTKEIVQPKAEEIAEDIPKAAEPTTPTLPTDVTLTSLTSGGPGVPGSPGNNDAPNSGFDGPSRGSEIPGPGVVSDQPYKLTGAIARPVLVSRVEPIYPEVARRTHQGGTVILQTVIDESGRVTNVTVVKGLGFGLQQAAIDAVSKWRFQPATMNGRAVKVFFNLTVQFSLS
ncbi:MAG TPA: TonB family protein [Thermoanaerobaculia bacterium]|jgi:protein TonB|nr:TonB family protein [Thermoanaerobaculia bacterium]